MQITAGDNKNRTIAAYLAWRTIVGLNDEITLSFMRVGHTRCFVDGGFGFVKQQYRKSDVDTVNQLVTAVNPSVGFNQAYTFSWEWRQWDAFLAQFFTAVWNVTKYQHFRLLSSAPGKVFLSGSLILDNKVLTIMKPNVNCSAMTTGDLSPTLQPAGLSRDRALYLYTNIWQHCHEESHDITCPEPAQYHHPIDCLLLL